MVTKFFLRVTSPRGTQKEIGPFNTFAELKAKAVELATKRPDCQFTSVPRQVEG